MTAGAVGEVDLIGFRQAAVLPVCLTPKTVQDAAAALPWPTRLLFADSIQPTHGPHGSCVLFATFQKCSPPCRYPRQSVRVARLFARDASLSFATDTSLEDESIFPTPC